jgi:hypothetical protein
VPPEVEWFANLSNKSGRRAYENAIRDFVHFTGIARPEKFRTVTCAHIIAWHEDLLRRGLGDGCDERVPRTTRRSSWLIDA